MNDISQPDENGIYQDSGFRLPLPRDDGNDPELTAMFKKFEAETKSPDRGKSGAGVGLRGPGGISMYSPEQNKLGTALSMYLRFRSGIDGRTRQLAVIATLRETCNQYAFTYHAGAAAREGVEPGVIDVVAYRKPVDGLAEKDRVLITLARQAITDHKVPRATFDAAIRLFGPKMLVDLLGILGNYVSASLMLETFDMQVEKDWVPLLPDIGKF